jgi:hypothetical protein
MTPRSRRQFMGDVGRGMLVAGLGSVAGGMGFSTAFANEGAAGLSFGELDPLVDLMQSTPVDRLQPLLVRKLQSGTTDLRQLMTAAALANAETFGGQDYVGFHTAMAMIPALEISDSLPTERRALPVLKVLYRNTQQIQQEGGAAKKTLAPVETEPLAGTNEGMRLRDAVRGCDMEGAERIFAGQVEASLEDAYNALQWTVQDDMNIHRFVLAHRAYELIDLIGADQAHTILRQSVRFCVDAEQNRVERERAESPIRALMPKLFDQYGLEGLEPGSRDPGDEWVAEMSDTIYSSPQEAGAEAVAAALAEGIDPETIGEAISLAANRMVLCQDVGDGNYDWRTHGDSRGVHASDAVNAFRNMARVTSDRNAIAGLIVAGFHTSMYGAFPGDAFPRAEHLAEISTREPEKLLQEAADAIRHNDQGRAAAAIHLYGEQGGSPDRVLNLMIRYTVSEDGRLHGEKYFQTVREEYDAIRPAYRWRQMVSLARVTASAYGYNREDEHGFRAPGYEEACRLIGVEA